MSESFRSLDVRRVDLAEQLGLDPAASGPGGPLRRVLRMKTGTDDVDWIVGTDVHPVTLSSESIQPLPEFLSGLRKSAGVAAIFVISEGTGLVLDLESLAQVAKPGR